MANSKISALTSATTPLAGTETVPIVQSGATVKATVANLTGAGNYAGSFTSLAYTTTLTGGTGIVALGTSQFYKDASGNIGIGTAVPGSKLEINESTNVSLQSNLVARGGNSLTAQHRYLTKTSGGVNTGGAIGFNATYGLVLTASTTTIDTARDLIINSAGNVTVSTGNLVIGTAGKGIDFSATAGTGTSELLADYEEGTWTPVLTFATAGNLSVTYSNQIGTYVKIGRAVILTCRLTTSAFTHTTASGALRITGMPFNAASRHYSAILFNGINKALYTTVVVNSDTSSSVLTFSTSGMGQSQASIAVADVPTAGTPFIQFTLCYETTS